MKKYLHCPGDCGAWLFTRLPRKCRIRAMIWALCLFYGAPRFVARWSVPLQTAPPIWARPARFYGRTRADFVKRFGDVGGQDGDTGAGFCCAASPGGNFSGYRTTWAADPKQPVGGARMVSGRGRFGRMGGRASRGGGRRVFAPKTNFLAKAFFF